MNRMMTKARMFIKTATQIVLVVILMTTGACQNPTQTAPAPGLGRLELNLGMVARSVLPVYDYAYAIDFYQVSGLGPEGAIFETAGFTGVTYSINGLEPGSWEISVTALNALQEVIAQTSFQTTIFADQTTSASPD